MSGPALTIRPASERHADGFVSVVRDGFDPAFQATMIYGCSGMGRFLRDQLALPDTIRDTHYTVAAVDGDVVGAVELREVGDALLLTYISIRASHRSGGLARRLLREATEAVARDRTEMILDVLTTNLTARRWYERLGFEPTYETDWWHVEAGPPTDAPRAPHGVTVRGYPQAQAAQARFGFSQFDVVTPEAAYAVGRLGTEWFRLTHADALRDAAVRAALHRLDPDRDVLAVLRRTPSGPTPEAATLRATTVRMTVPLAQLLGRLTA